MPTLSIIVLIYNVEKYLRRCIHSIINQTFSDFELILVDDGSPDRCGEICDEYALRDSRISVIHQTNMGLGAARNKGLSVAKGRYIGFVDPDDVIEPKMYEELINAALHNNAQICVCNFSECYEGSEHKTSIDIPENVVNLKNTLDLMRVISTTQITRVSIVLQVLWNKIFKAETIKVVTISGRYGEDCDAINKIYSKNYIIHLINKPLYVYTLRNDSLIRTKSVKEQVRFLDIYKERWHLYNDSEIRLSAKRLYCISYLIYYYGFIKADLEWTEDKETFRRCFWEVLKQKRSGLKLFVRGVLYLFNENVFCFLEDVHQWLYSKYCKK